LKLYLENDNVAKYEDVVKRFNWWTNGKSLKATTKIEMIISLVYILFFGIWCILDPNFFTTGGKYL